MKKIMVKNGTYTNKDGETKNRYTQVGVIMQGENGEFALLDPTVNLAGFDRGDKNSVIAGIFEDNKDSVKKESSQSNSQEVDLDNEIPF